MSLPPYKIMGPFGPIIPRSSVIASASPVTSLHKRIVVVEVENKTIGVRKTGTGNFAVPSGQVVCESQVSKQVKGKRDQHTLRFVSYGPNFPGIDRMSMPHKILGREGRVSWNSTLLAALAVMSVHTVMMLHVLMTLHAITVAATFIEYGLRVLQGYLPTIEAAGDYVNEGIVGKALEGRLSVELKSVKEIGLKARRGCFDDKKLVLLDLLDGLGRAATNFDALWTNELVGMDGNEGFIQTLLLFLEGTRMAVEIALLALTSALMPATIMSDRVIRVKHTKQLPWFIMLTPCRRLFTPCRPP